MTRYGMQAIALDWTGTLREAIVQKTRVSVKAQNVEHLLPAKFSVVGGSTPGWC